MAGYLIRRNRQYHFRIRVPSDLTSILGCQELHRSLRTADLRSARALTGILRAKADTAFASIRLQRSLAPTGSLEPVAAHAVLDQALPLVC